MMNEVGDLSAFVRAFGFLLEGLLTWRVEVAESHEREGWGSGSWCMEMVLGERK